MSRQSPNRLLKEKSPYLLQHAHNPVDWYPWGEEAFARARLEDKPIFLSIGYSTCHWCHVMERESFENATVAALLDRWFVAVKVDREERPDVDRLYMTALQAMGLGGGWPLTAFLTPDLKPFHGGTYFPAESRAGHPGMIDLLPRVAEAWAARRDELAGAGDRVLEAIEAHGVRARGGADRDTLFEHAYDSLGRSEDVSHGGFGTAPKFPSPANLNFLLRRGWRDPERERQARDMAFRQLDAMQAGGIHDHLGGGFHRYSTDRSWLVPHFEKMLYDQALLARAYLDAAQITGRADYAAAARGVFDYVARDLTGEDGAFDSAEDADSEGEEGRFYVWTRDEIVTVLGPEEAPLVIDHYGVTPAGNFEHGTNILHTRGPVAATAARHGIAEDEAAERLAHARAQLLQVRSRRVRPHRDDKVLACWNGLMIAAFARGARVLGDAGLAGRAARAAEFVWSRLFDPATGTLRRRWRDGEAAGAGQLDDHACLALGLTELYRATFEPRWLARAARLTEEQLARFWDDGEPGFFESPPGDASVRLRMKSDYDGAELAGNSIAALNLVTLGRLLERPEWSTRAHAMLETWAGRIERAPVAMPQLLLAMDLELAAARHVVLASGPSEDERRGFVREFDRRFLPHDELLVVNEEHRAALAGLAPFAAGLAVTGGRTTAYVCVDQACRLPTHDLAVFAAQLDEHPAPSLPTTESR